jgi:hypothetical protein
LSAWILSKRNLPILYIDDCEVTISITRRRFPCITQV